MSKMKDGIDRSVFTGILVKFILIKLRPKKR